MNDPNPTAENAAGVADAGIRRDGNAVVLPSGCIMPQRCVITNLPVAESDMVLANLGWSPSSNLLYLILGSPFFLLVALANRELCLITYGLNRRLRVRLIGYTVLKILAAIGLLCATVLLAITTSRNPVVDPLVWITFILFIISVALVVIGNSRLRVVKFRDGMFWVEGFSQEYLDELEF